VTRSEAVEPGSGEPWAVGEAAPSRAGRTIQHQRAVQPARSHVMLARTAWDANSLPAFFFVIVRARVAPGTQFSPYFCCDRVVIRAWEGWRLGMVI
jgi:hypothetical protein